MKYTNRPLYQNGAKYFSKIASKINNKQQITEQERKDYSDNYHKLASKGVDANGEEYLNANLPEVEVTAKRIPYTQGLPTPYKLMEGYADMAGQVMNTPAALVGEAAHGRENSNFARAIPQHLNPYSKHWQGDKGTPEQRNVSDALNIQNPVGRFAVDMVTDPTTWMGAGAIKNAAKIKPKNLQQRNFLNEATDATAEYQKLINDPRALERAKNLDKEFGMNLSQHIPKWSRGIDYSGKDKFVLKNNDDWEKYVFPSGNRNAGFSGISFKSDSGIKNSNKSFKKAFNSSYDSETGLNQEKYIRRDVDAYKKKPLKFNRLIGLNTDYADDLSNTVKHELKHDLTSSTNLLSNSYKDNQKKFIKSKENLPENYDYDYYSNPTELDAHLSTNERQKMVDKGILKNHFDNLDEEKLDNYLKSTRNPEYKDALDIVGDKPEQRKAFVDWFNKALPAAGTGVIANETLKDKKQNGGIIMKHKIYNKGGSILYTDKKQTGGVIDPVSSMGYKDNSPYNSAKQLPIYSSSGAITMNGVSKPLMVKDVDNNEVRYLKPNSGVHQFKGQNFIEKPVFADGGNYGYIKGHTNEPAGYSHPHYFYQGEVNASKNERRKLYKKEKGVSDLQNDLLAYGKANNLSKEEMAQLSRADGLYGPKTAESLRKHGKNVLDWKYKSGTLTAADKAAYEKYVLGNGAPETNGNNAQSGTGTNNGNTSSSSGATNKYGSTTEPNLYNLQYNNPNNNQPYVFENKPMFRNTPTNATYNSPGYFSDTRPQSEANDNQSNEPLSNKERLRNARKERMGQIGTNVSNWIDDWRGRRADKIEIRNAMRRDKEANREGYRDAQADSNRAIVTADSDYRVQKHDYKTRGRLNKLDDATQAKLDRLTDKQNRLVVEKDAQSGRERRDYSYKPVAGSSENYAAENIENGQNKTFDNIQDKPVYTPKPILDRVNYTERQIQPMKRVEGLPQEEQPIADKAPVKRVDNFVEDIARPSAQQYDINNSMNDVLYPKKFNGGKVKSLQVYRVGGSIEKKYDNGGGYENSHYNYVEQFNRPETKKFNINDTMNQILYPQQTPQANNQQSQTEQGYYRVGDVGGARMNADDMTTVDSIYGNLGTAKANPNYQTPETNSNPIGSSSGANTGSRLKGEGRSPLHQGELMQLAGSAIAPLYDLGRSFAKPVHERDINNKYRYQVLDAQRKQRYNPNYKPIIANMAATQNNIRENSSNSQVARANQIAAMNAGNEMLSQEANKELMANQELANRYNTLKMGIGDAEAAEQKRIYENNMQHDTLRENMRHNVATQLGALTVDAGKRRTTDAMNQLDYSMLNTIYNNYGVAAYSAVKAGLADGHDLVYFKGDVQKAQEAKQARMQQGNQQAPATKVQTSPVTSPSGDVKAGEITTTTTQR